MKLVAAALGNDAHLAAGAAPKLGRSDTGLHGKLLHGISNAEVAERGVDLRINVADTVEQEDVGLGACPGHVEAATLRARGRGQDTWGQKGQVQILARVQRHVRYDLALDHVTYGAPVRLEQGDRAACNFYDLANAATLKLGVQVGNLVDFDHDAGHDALFEASGFY